MKNFLTLLVLTIPITLLIIVSSCGPKKIDPTTYKILSEDKQITEIPEVCKSYYENLKELPTVAVVDFTNNTTFDVAKVLQAHGSRVYTGSTTAVMGAGIAPGGVIAGYGSTSQSYTKINLEAISRNVNAKLGQSVASGVSAFIAEMGGAKIYTRQDLQKILNEQKFQQSGLVDEKTLVKVGKLAGVRYIVTGSVDNVTIKWIDVEYLKQGLQKHLGLVGSVLAAGVETQEGWNISTDLTIKIIDVQTGEILFAKNVSGRAVLGKVPTLTYDAIIGGIKNAAKNALEEAKKPLSKYFSVRGYIIQLRTSPDKSERYALINIGSKQGIKSGYEFYVYDFEEVIDPLTRRKSCDLIKLPVILEATNQIQPTKTWTVVKGDKNQIFRIKLGQIVERAPLD